MPLVRIALPADTAPAWRRAVADGVHRALVDTVDVPLGDRFQLIEPRAHDERIIDAAYLGIARGDGAVIITISLRRGRSDAEKRALYRAIAGNLAAAPGVRREDVMIVLSENDPVDWSFGAGVAQYAPGP